MTADIAREWGRVAVVGSGISGLAATFHLTNAGISVDLIEREQQLGGRFGIAKLGDRPVMMGGKNIGRRYSDFRAFIAALGHHPYEEFGINSSRVESGRVVTYDSSNAGQSVRNAFKGARPRDIARLVRLARRVRADEANRFLGSPFFAKLADRHDDAPLSAHFGHKVARRLLRPMTVRMNGAEPDEVYLGTLGTNLALVLDRFDQLQRGVQPVLDAIEERVTVRRGCHVDGVLVKDGRVTGLRFAQNGAPNEEHDYDAVVAATPAHAAATLLRSEYPALSSRLDEVSYFPTTVVLAEYDRPMFTEDIRALAMDDSPCSNAGAYGREDRHVVRYTFSGRDARTLGRTTDQLDDWLGEAEERLRCYVRASLGAQRVESVTRHWSHGYCGYVPFHGQFLGALRRDVDAAPGLALAGDYLCGVSLEACFRSGRRAAERVLEQR